MHLILDMWDPAALDSEEQVVLSFQIQQYLQSAAPRICGSPDTLDVFRVSGLERQFLLNNFPASHRGDFLHAPEDRFLTNSINTTTPPLPAMAVAILLTSCSGPQLVREEDRRGNTPQTTISAPSVMAAADQCYPCVLRVLFSYF